MTNIRMAALAAVLAAATAGAAHAQGAELTPTDIVNRHMAAAAKADIDAIVADYADDAVVLTAGHATQGKAAIRAQFAAMLGPRPAPAAGAPAAAAPPGGGMQVQKVWQEGDVGFVSWTSGPVSGNDSFLVRHGKVLVQSVFMSGGPAAAAAAAAGK